MDSILKKFSHRAGVTITLEHNARPEAIWPYEVRAQWDDGARKVRRHRLSTDALAEYNFWILEFDTSMPASI